MIDPDDVPPVADDEMLARYVLQSSHIRKSNNTVKPDAFMPPSNHRFSVTRHLSATDEEIWLVGRSVAALRDRTLYGRADMQAMTCLSGGLRIEAAPIPGNSNHANVTGWPSDKAAQKIGAQEIAAAAVFAPTPQTPAD